MSEQYYYNRSENLLGVSDIDLDKIAPSYGMTVKFKAENKTMDFSDGPLNSKLVYESFPAPYLKTSSMKLSATVLHGNGLEPF